MRPHLIYCTAENYGLHLWIGPFGLHLFWPDLWHSRPGYCGDWRRNA